MKTPILCALFLICTFNLSAQTTEETNDNDHTSNEVKLNALFMIIGAFDVTYEHLLNEESGIGLNIFIPFDGDINDDINYFVSPYYRLYFGKKYAAGFFLEGFGMLNSVNNVVRNGFFGGGDVIEVVNEDIVDFALGIGLGGKWVTNNGFIGELNIGFGRNLFRGEDEGGDDFVGKIGITVGYRF